MIAFLAAAPSLSELAIASGPQSAAPTSFNGNGWLFVINLWLMTASTYLGAFALTGLGKEVWRYRADGLRHPANIVRTIAMLGLACFALRCCAEALTLWAWNPNDIATAAWARETKRWLDPMAVAAALAAISLAATSWPELVKQLSRKPLPVSMWITRHMLWRPVCLVGLSFVAAFGVVVTR